MNYKVRKELGLKFSQIDLTEFEFNFYIRKGLETILALFPHILDNLSYEDIWTE